VSEVFADSFYWIALLNPADAFHEIARATPISGRIVTSLAVQLEVLDAFSAYLALRPVAIRFWERTTQDPQVTVVPLTADLVQGAMDLFRQRDDKTWSFTDCVSFEIMRRRGIVMALSADRHFRQAGFETAFVS
jgi:predicted nucleic acid-binding protein